RDEIMQSGIIIRGSTTLVLSINNICNLNSGHLRINNQIWKSGKKILSYRGISGKTDFSHTLNDSVTKQSDHHDLKKETKTAPLTRSNGNNSESRKYKVIFEPLSKVLMSDEVPFIHVANAGAVVDIKSKIFTNLHVDQLLKESRSSVKVAKNIKHYDEENDYVEETKDKKKVHSGLTGALNPGALDWRPQKLLLNKLGQNYAGLAKSRLTGLVVMTAMTGYAMAPGPFDPLILLCCSLGTCLTSSAANAINQFCEVPYDSQMDRTKNRVLVRGLLTPLHAVTFAGVCGSLGVATLYIGCNTTAAILGGINLLLYTSAYTPMKRVSIVNTWVGSVVGAIPPMIGWSAATGQLEGGAWILAGVLFAWQFPHFNALSWNLRPDYSRAGYRMMSVTNPNLCRRVALRYSIAMFPICILAPVLDLTTWTFAIDSLPVNGYLTYLAWKFYQEADSKSSRKLFMFTLIHLPAILGLMIISKKYNNEDEKDETQQNIAVKTNREISSLKSL
ncbi:unnamed protein product, partial [Meganyctiphanes norvegica]